MIGHTTIIFNDTVVATTDKIITYERENENQKEFHFTDKRSELTAVLFCESLELIENEHVLVEIL
jgi:hypothetical protein